MRVYVGMVDCYSREGECDLGGRRWWEGADGAVNGVEEMSPREWVELFCGGSRIHPVFDVSVVGHLHCLVCVGLHF